MNYESFGAFAGAELAPTPKPFDPTGELEATFEATHAGYLDSTGDVDVFPPEEVAEEVVVPEAPVEPEAPVVEPEAPVDEPPAEEPAV